MSVPKTVGEPRLIRFLPREAVLTVVRKLCAFTVSLCFGAGTLFLLEVKQLPNAKVLEEKKQIVADLVAKMKSASAGVLVDYKGITVADDTKLRRSLREAGVQYTVIKNSMLHHAFAGTELESMSEHLNGTTALATSETDVVAPAKLLSKYIKSQNGEFAVKAGFAEGKVLSAEGVAALAKLPDRNTLLATVFGTMKAPISALARCLQQIVDKQSEPAAEEAAAPAEA